MPIINPGNLKSLSFHKKRELIEKMPPAIHIEKLPWVPMFTVPAILLLPTFIWVMLDNSPFGGDQSIYATQSVSLFHALVVSPLSWAKLIFASGASKAPGIAWLGQFFVPLGYWIGSVDKGLLFSIIATQFISLVLLFVLIWEITDHDTLGAFLGCLILASAPLFVYTSKEYMVESLQTLSTTWFLLIMVFSPRWGKALTISQLLGATMVAMLAKVSSPLFCFVPGLVALGFTFFPQQSYKQWDWQNRKTLLTLALAIPISFATIIWYLKNYRSVFEHVAFASTGKVAAIWGKEDTFLNTLTFWLDSIRRTLFLSDILLFLVLSIIVVGGSYVLIKAGSASNNFRLFSTAIILQVAIVLAVFALSSNRSIRYILPLVPYIPFLTCLILSRIHKSVLTVLLVSIFVVQYSYFHARNLEIMEVTPQTAPRIMLIEHSDKSKQVLQSIVDHTCKKENNDILNVLAIDPLIKGDWLAPAPANYVVAKSLGTGAHPPCRYEHVGNSFFGSSVEDAWDRILSMNVKYVIITDPKIYAPPVNALNQVLDPENIVVFLDYLENSGYFHKPFQLPEDPGILIFKRNKK